MKERRRVKIEVALLGAAAVGKTSIVRRFSSGAFIHEYTPTVEEYYTCVLRCKRRVVLLSITDMSGCFHFPVMRKLAINRAEAFVIVFSVENSQSFEEVRKMLDDVLRERQNECIPIMIVGNKNDTRERIISPDDVLQLIGENSTANCKLNYIETSAKEDINIANIFQGLVNLLVAQEFPKHNRKEQFNVLNRKCTIL